MASGSAPDDEGSAERAELAYERAGGVHAIEAPEARVGPLGRLSGFLQGSWKELHRVQWPDRRQTMQATGVVLGFVIVAGIFLGVADYVAQQIVTLITK